MKFQHLKIASSIKKRLVELGLNRPTDIQFKAIPHILDGEDVLGIAQTGTGKTAAFVIPILNLILERKKDLKKKEGIQCLVMVPTRELAIQIAEAFETIGKGTPVKVLALYGGADEDAKQKKRLNIDLDVLVTTPGRMFDLNKQGYMRFENVKSLVIDEADHMLDLGFLKDIQDVVRMLPKQRQTLFFSATIDSKIKKLAYDIVRNAIRIQISPKDPVSNKVEHSVMFVEMDDKRFFLERIINENPDSKFIVFARTKVRVERVAKAMNRVGIFVETIHGDKPQKERIQAIEGFKDGGERVLIATDVSARGIDVKKVDYVINYDLPDVTENYVHRIGRTGRGNHKGTAVSFCSKEEKPLLDEIESYLKKEIKVINISKNDKEETLDLGGDKVNDWQTVVGKIEDFSEESRRRKKKRKK